MSKQIDWTAFPVMGFDQTFTDNPVWSIPPRDTDEVRGELNTRGMWSIPVSYRALAMDMHKRVFGIKTMTNVRESGYDLEGRLSIGGCKYRAFTSSQMFTRTDGSLCNVAIIYVCDTPIMRYRDPLTMDGQERIEYCKGVNSRYFYQSAESEGLYYKLKEYMRAVELIATGYAATVPWVRYEEQAKTLRAELTELMGWDGGDNATV